MNGQIIRPQTCVGCKSRRVDAQGQFRCHAMPPQRNVISIPTPKGFEMNFVVDFPEVRDEWSCDLWKPRLAVAAAS